MLSLLNTVSNFGNIMLNKSIHLANVKMLFISLMLLTFSSELLAAEDLAKPKLSTDYVSLGKPMVLNLSSKRNRLSFLQISADVQVKSDNAKEIAEKFVPVFRHILILKLSEQNAQEMKTVAKREELRTQASKQIREVINELSDASEIKDILFSKYLVQ